MAEIILAQVKQALHALMLAGSSAFGDEAPEGETSDRARQVALLQSVAMMVGKMPDPIPQDGALANWTRQLLQMLEDGAGSVEVENGALPAFFRAVGSMQELFGVPVAERAWSEAAELEWAKASALDRFTGFPGHYIEQARHLLEMLLPVARGHAAGAVPHLERLADALALALQASSPEEWRARAAEADAAMGAAQQTEAWSAASVEASYSLWGLAFGIEETMRRGEEWLATELRLSAGVAAPGEALTELSGERGERAQIVRASACDISGLAELVTGFMEKANVMGARPFLRMLRDIQHLAGLTLSACDDSMMTLAELRERAAR